MSIILKSGSLEAFFSEKNGALTGMKLLKTGWIIHRREELGLSFRLLVPVHDELRNNPVFGEKQKLASYTANDREVKFRWNGVESERAGKIDVNVEITVRVEDEQLVWYTRIENNSPYVVESVNSPYIGDFTKPADAEWLKTYIYTYNTGTEWDLWPICWQHEGDHGTDYPTLYGGSNACGTPVCPWFLIRGPKEGLYAGVKENRPDLVAWGIELHPGYDESINAHVPEGDELNGHPIHFVFAPVHMCYIQPGDSENLTPIALEAFTGDWHDGVDIYKKWLATWSNPKKVPEWAKEPHSWLQLHVNSPEDELRLRYSEIPKVAKECADAGIKVLQITGWNKGGQDQNGPCHHVDERLGTFEEFRNAIAECHKMGVKVILFSKFTWADRAESWFRNELIKYSVKDPYGDYYLFGGYEYFTPAQLLGINVKQMVPMCFGSEEYLKIAQQEFKQIVDLGADGMLFDECEHHSPTLLCFDTSHNHKYGWPTYANDNRFIEVMRTTEGFDEDNFLFGGEGVYDLEFEEYGMSYLRSRYVYHGPTQRYIRPFIPMATCVIGFNDRNIIGQCLMYRYMACYEPFYFKGWPHDDPLTIAYGIKMDKLRTELRKWFWDGEFRDTCGVKVTKLDGSYYRPYSRFEAKDGTSGVVICNYERNQAKVRVELENGQILEKYRSIDNEEWKPTEDGIIIEPLSAVVVI
ncbi:MAG: hypothetical protein IKS28_08520 [Clostridia bacterium]|nr:hypothetical protein [Clostridia bacterium]